MTIPYMMKEITMTLYVYTVFSIIAIIGFMIANHHYGLPMWGSIGLMFSLVLCVRGVLIAHGIL